MNSENILKTVRKVIARVVEEASFVFTDELGPELKGAAEMWDAQGVSLSFTGEQSGCFRIWADRAFARLLAANMLGLDMSAGPEQEIGTDALREMTNIIVGNSLTEIFGDRAVFNLGIPEQALDSLKIPDYERTDGIWLQAEDYTLLCVVDILTEDSGFKSEK
jgi:CheY-specific phosphatase CheX